MKFEKYSTAANLCNLNALQQYNLKLNDLKKNISGNEKFHIACSASKLSMKLKFLEFVLQWKNFEESTTKSAKMLEYQVEGIHSIRSCE